MAARISPPASVARVSPCQVRPHSRRRNEEEDGTTRVKREEAGEDDEHKRTSRHGAEGRGTAGTPGPRLPQHGDRPEEPHRQQQQRRRRQAHDGPAREQRHAVAARATGPLDRGEHDGRGEAARGATGRQPRAAGHLSAVPRARGSTRHRQPRARAV